MVTLAVFEKNECKFLRDNHRISGRLNRKKGTQVSVFVGYVLLFGSVLEVWRDVFAKISKVFGRFWGQFLKRFLDCF